MFTDLTRLELTLRRRIAFGYAFGVAAYTLLIVVLYPDFKNSTSLDNLAKGTTGALFGLNGPLTSPGGWLNGNVFGNFLPLIMLLSTIGYGAASVAGQDEDGTLAMQTVLPIGRDSIALQKMGAMAVQVLSIAVCVAICVVIGRAFQIDISVGNVIGVSFAAAVMGFDFGVVALAVGAVTGRRGSALGVGATVAVVSYLLSALATTISWIRPGRYVSLFYWSVGDDQIDKGVAGLDLIVLILVGLAAGYVALWAFRRTEVT